MFCKKIRQRREALNIMRSFVQGKICTEDFWDIYKQNIFIQQILKNDKLRKKKEMIISPNHESFMPINADNALSKININNLDDCVALYMIVKLYFWHRKENIQYYNKEQNIQNFVNHLVPDWVGEVDSEFIINNLPVSYNTIDKSNLQTYKEIITSLFKYDMKKPNWIQEPKWPIVDGVAYVFSHQSTTKEGYECYYFYDPNDKTKIVVVEQCE